MYSYRYCQDFWCAALRQVAAGQHPQRPRCGGRLVGLSLQLRRLLAPGPGGAGRGRVPGGWGHHASLPQNDARSLACSCHAGLQVVPAFTVSINKMLHNDNFLYMCEKVDFKSKFRVEWFNRSHLLNYLHEMSLLICW